MSFIYDKDVLNEIIKHAQNISLNSNLMINIAKKLSNKLDREFRGIQEPPNIISSVESKLTPENTHNIDSFIKYLTDTKVNIDGERLSFPPSYSNQYDSVKTPQIIPFDIKLNRIEPTRQFTQDTYFVNKNAISKYLKFLQSKAIADNNDIMLVIINTLINKFKSSITDIDLEKVEKSKPGEKKLNPDEILDLFDNKRFDPILYSISTTGQIQLKVKDLYNKESLNYWLLRAPEATVKMGNDFIPYSDEGVDSCIIIQILFKRASERLRLSKTSEERQKYTFYLEQIQKLSSEFAGPDGKPCSVVQQTTKTTTTTKTTDKTEESEEQGGLSQESLKLLSRLISILPLERNSINFSKIQAFINAYNDFDVSSRSQLNSEGIKIKIDEIFNKIEIIYKSRSVDLNQSASYISSLLTNRYRDMLHFLGLISDLISIVSSCLNDLKSKYGHGMPESFQNKIDEQTANFARNNLAIIYRWKSDYDEYVKKLQSK